MPTSTSANKWARTLSSTPARTRSGSSAAGTGFAAPFGENFGKIRERLGLARSRRVDPLGMAGRQSTNIAIERKRLGHAAEQMEADDAGRFRIARNMSAREQRLDLRGEAECPAIVCRVERLDAVGIARKEEATPRLVPDGESEHATEPMHHLGAVARVEMQQRLRVGGRAEARAVASRAPRAAEDSCRSRR